MKTMLLFLQIVFQKIFQKFLLILFLIVINVVALAQESNLDKAKLSSSECYKKCAGFIQIYNAVSSPDPDFMNLHKIWYTKDKNNRTTNNFFKGYISGSNKGDDAYLTKIMFTVDKNEIYCVVFDPHYSETSLLTNYVEAAIMLMKGGDVYEIDYGYVKKNRIESDDNKYTEEIVLEGGSRLFIEDKL